jgi:hypothetical protein
MSMTAFDYEQPDLFGDPQPPAAQTICCPTCHGRGTVVADLSGKVGKNHPSTSVEVRTRANRIGWHIHRRIVLSHLLEHGPSTAAEVSETLGKSRNETAARLQECRELGHVVYALDETGARIRRRTSAHGSGLVQEITAEGRRVLAEAQRGQQ